MAQPKKLKIHGYTSDPSSSGGGGEGDKVFETSANPMNIKRNRKVLFNSNNRSSGSIDVKQWRGYGEETMEFTITLDVYSAENLEHEVSSERDNLFDVIYNYDGSIHKALWLKVEWGGYFSFLGHLKSVNESYTIFKSSGEPTKANIDLEFTIHYDYQAAARGANRSSPDMSHVMTIKESDKIPLICNDIYKDPSYYIQIAELNNLTNFRSVKAGRQLLFPPLISE